MRSKVLYKYYPNDDFFFRDRMVRISPRSALNDPFEIRPSLDALSKYAEPHLKESLTEEQLNQLLNSNYDNMFKVYGGAPVFNDYGVFCLTETRTNLLMWSHYANSHKGMVIGFDVSHPFFNQSLGSPKDHYGIEVGRMHRVVYSNYRASESVDATDWYLLKSDEWIYEKEHRLILPLAKCDKVVRNLLNGDPNVEINNREEIESTENLGHHQHICLSQIPLDAICSVTFGAETKQSTRFGVKAYFANSDQSLRHRSFRFELAIISRNRFELEIHNG